VSPLEGIGISFHEYNFQRVMDELNIGLYPGKHLLQHIPLDGASRFQDAKQVRSYLGLLPREHSSGEKQHRGRISKAGNSRARALLVEAAWALLRWKTPKTEALHEWATRIAARRGKATAVVALARKMAGILFAIWRDGTEFNPEHLSGRSPAGAVAGG
jgi:hypothetical protein